jgi:formylglycine-generating enzyme required for sulfatase activity
MSSPSSPTGNADAVPLVLAAGARPLPDYELKALLGRGGFGEVWRATGAGGFDVALKFVRREGKEGDVERRALETIKGLRHAHLLPVFGAWERLGWLIVAMELADKTLMDRFLECHAAGQRGIPREELLGYLRDSARGLDYLTEARPGFDGKMTFLQHRDVKPQNLMLVGGTVKVADFGLIKVLKHTATQASSKMTLAYAPPELFGEKLTRWSDQYSLAVSYCLLRGGRMPFSGNAAQLTIGHLQRPPDLSMLPEAERPAVARALEKEPEKRWPNCTAFAEAVAQVQRPPSPSAVALPPPMPLPPALPTRIPAAGELTRHAERRGTDDRPPIHATLSTLHRPLPPPAFQPAAQARDTASSLANASGTDVKPSRLRAIPIKWWLGLGGLVVMAAFPCAIPWIARGWRGNTAQPEPADNNDPGPRDGPLGMTFVKLPKGTFYMGWDGETKGKKTEIKEDFQIAIHTVTQGQWQALMGNNPSYFSRGGGGKDDVKNISDDDLKQFPMETVSWNDAQKFIKKLNEQEKGSGWFYRLPTEAEWEYSCRGGATSEADCSWHFYFDKPTNDLSSEQANFDGNNPYGKAPKGKYLLRPTKVGSYKPNKLGLYDMHGNVWQWCSDLYDPPASARVLRGGGWDDSGWFCRSAYRGWYEPGERLRFFGLRLAAVPEVGAK